MSFNKSDSKQSPKQRPVWDIIIFFFVSVLVFVAVFYFLNKPKEKNVSSSDFVAHSDSASSTINNANSASMVVAVNALADNATTPQDNLTRQNPLTGLPNTKNKEVIPIGVMIDNFPNDLAHGIANASIVYEAPVEGGMTRFLALYDLADIPEKIGSIRSARPYFIDIANEYGGLFVHAGGSPEALATLRNRQMEIYNLDEISSNTIFFFRDTKKEAPFNLFTSFERLKKYVERNHIAPLINFNQWRFNTSSQTSASELSQATESAEAIEIGYKYKVTWQWDSSRNAYKRLNDINIYTDQLNGSEITAKNIILQFAPIKVADDIGRRLIDLSGSGKIYWARNGKISEGVWIKQNNRTTFYDTAKNEIKLVPGTTWVEIVSNAIPVIF